jgi:hypothetical protein
VPLERYPHTSKEVMVSVLLPAGYSPSVEPGGGARYQDLQVSGDGQLSIRRFLAGLAHTPSPQVAAELHLHSGDGSRRWISGGAPAEIDGAVATSRAFIDDENATEGTVITAELGETMLSIRAIWPQVNLDQRDQLLAMIDSIRLLALEDLAVRRNSQLHPVFSISVARPAEWKITHMDEESWEFSFPGGSCTMRELDTGVDMSGATVSEITQLIEDLVPDAAMLGATEIRPSATRSPMYACEWNLDDAAGIAAVLLREIPILISLTSPGQAHLRMLRDFIDGVRTHPALY